MFPSLRLLPTLLILSLIACCIEIDISVPGFPDMVRHFGTTEEMIQLSLALNFLGFCLSGFFYGPLSECWGRRRIMLWGNVLFFIGGLGCVFAPSIGFLLFSRFFQGMGASATCIVAFAMIADAFKGDRAASFIGIMNSVLTAFMAIAPVAGGFINNSFGWRANYTVVAVVGLLSLIALTLFLPETKVDRPKFSWKNIIGDYRQLVASPKFLAYAMAPSMMAGAYFSFVAVGAFLYIDQLGVPLVAYSLHQGAIVGTFSVVSFFSGRVAARFGNRTTTLFSSGLMMAAVVTLLICYKAPPLVLTSLMCLFAGSVSLCFNLVFTKSLEIFPDIRGAASAFIMSTRMLLCAGTIWLAAHFYNNTLLPTALVMTAAAAVGSLLIVALYRRQPVIA